VRSYPAYRSRLGVAAPAKRECSAGSIVEHDEDDDDDDAQRKMIADGGLSEYDMGENVLYFHKYDDVDLALQTVDTSIHVWTR